MKNKRPTQVLTKEDWLMIAKEYASMGPTDLAAKLKVSKQRIQQVATFLRKNGIAIPRLKIEKGHTKEYIAFIKSKLK